MTRHTIADAEPIYTSTRVPPAESVDQYSQLTDGTEAAREDDPIAATRMSPAVTRFG